MSEWMTEERFLRHVKFRPRDGVIYTLCIYDVQGVEGACAPPQFPVGYEFRTASKTLFAGVDFGCSPLHAIDSDACVCGLMNFLCLRPGDTDADYFRAYTADQRDWAQSCDCEFIGASVAVRQELAEKREWEDGETWE